MQELGIVWLGMFRRLPSSLQYIKTFALVSKKERKKDSTRKHNVLLMNVSSCFLPINSSSGHLVNKKPWICCCRKGQHVHGDMRDSQQDSSWALLAGLPRGAAMALCGVLTILFWNEVASSVTVDSLSTSLQIRV